jgi:hypothetical protein
MRDLARPLRERTLERRRAEIEALYDQIASARQRVAPDQLPAAIDALLRAKEEARRRAADELSTLAAYEELFSVTLVDNTIIVREAERLFTAEDFPQGVKAVNMIVRVGTNSQILVALANANPYVPQLEVNVAGAEPGWVQGSLNSMEEVISRGQPLVLWHWRAWLQPYVLPTLTWALFAWFFAVVFEYYRIPILWFYSWLGIFAALLPAAGSLVLLQRAIPPFGVSRSGQESATDILRGLFG